MPKSKTKGEIEDNVRRLIDNANKKKEQKAARAERDEDSRGVKLPSRPSGVESVHKSGYNKKRPRSENPWEKYKKPRSERSPPKPPRKNWLKSLLNMEACWDGYKVPKEKKFKKKNGRLVPNCIPEELMEVLKKHQNPEGGLNQAGREHYNSKTGSKLQRPVSAKEASRSDRSAARRRSFCARMKGVSGPMEKDGKPTRKALALRKWDCN